MNRPTVITIHTNARPHVHESDNFNNTYAVANMVAGRCSTRSTCFKGYCWAYCGTTLVSGDSYCWTTKGASKDGAYVKCVHNFDCNPCWNCAGACGK